MREGRCYDVIEFRLLTPAEAIAARKAHGLPDFEETPTKDMSLADPTRLKTIDPCLIDVIVVPAVAYDRAGNRLGMGAGYYDRFIPQALQAVRIGAIWSTQMIDQVPCDPYDKPVHYLLREDGIVPCDTGQE